MGWDKKGEYEIAMDEEIDNQAKKQNIVVKYKFSSADWWSPDIKIKGENPKQDQSNPFHGIKTLGYRNREDCLREWRGISEEIPGLKCYYCNSQGFKTDMPGVAVCGAAPGWFFFYRRISKEAKPRIKIINGNLVEVEEEGIVA